MQVLVGGQASTAAGGARSSLQQQQDEQEMGAAAGTVDLDDEHVFLYKLVPGVVASSYGVSPQAGQNSSYSHTCASHARFVWPLEFLHDDTTHLQQQAGSSVDREIYHKPATDKMQHVTRMERQGSVVSGRQQPLPTGCGSRAC
jgi:hypothetical protein